MGGQENGSFSLRYDYKGTLFNDVTRDSIANNFVIDVYFIFIHMNLDHIIATTSFMSRDLDNLQATKLLFSAGGRKQ